MPVAYVSTRGEAPVLGFADALLAGLARDGGLYVPDAWPTLSHEQIADLAGKSYAEAAEAVIAPFVGDSIAPDKLRAMIEEAYATFRHPAVSPLVQTGSNRFVLELFHGPTLAFKDVAMQLLARMMDHVLAERGLRTTIVGATSGDTGGAAIDAFRGRDRADVFILMPHGKVSEVQRRQMTTAVEDNVHAIAIDGSFDDAQALVKALFNHHNFRDRLALGGVNSINWARVLAQAVYYFVAAVALGAPARGVNFVVPTGNFGDIFAGYVAKRMGLPINRLVIATNVNDILARTLETGRYEVRGVEPTTSPSMDIQVSSNFERLLFDAGGRDPETVRRAMSSLAQSGAFELDAATLANIRTDFDAGRADEAAVAETIDRVRRETGYLLDPHTAVAYAVAERADLDPATPTVVLSTAHPAKFPDAVEAASGVRPELPPHLAELLEKPEKLVRLPGELGAIESFVESHARVARGAAA
ncbi:threonine synthase [Hansschlegelia plantiphila]|uniref:Threonine synthase n=1 Tax=Hansschlegelia plantiphila TaxID=374655 RepID=A0A9W6IZ74_9HYPH|nr:threonine synthase [Hansschlegelia plantiphila]GLK67742.1 threonine synthase [Hansschlegelia plantiphila]